MDSDPEPAVIAELAAREPKIRLFGPLCLSLAPKQTPKQMMRRKLLALLALNPCRVVGNETIRRELWGDNLGTRSSLLIQAYIHRLRQIEEASGYKIVTHALGYELQIEPHEVDAIWFIKMIKRVRLLVRSQQFEDASLLLEGARNYPLAGRPLENIACGELLMVEMNTISRYVATASRLRYLIALATRRHEEVLEDLWVEWDSAPDREDLALLLMIVLTRVGRRSDALEIYYAVERFLEEERGIAPEERLREAVRQIKLGREPIFTMGI